MMQLSSTATSILQQAAHQKPMIAIKIKWFSNNHNKGRFTQHYLCLMERPLRESSAVVMELQAAFWPLVSRACDKMSCEQGSPHWVPSAAPHHWKRSQSSRAVMYKSCYNEKSISNRG